MKLLDVSTLQFHEFLGSNIPPYAILSHTWGTEEVDFQEMQEQCNETKSKSGYLKVKKCCEKAAAHGYKYAWVDSCCIDKRSSAELSEAINSMFNWYRKSQECFVYLADVQKTSGFPTVEFQKSRWFTRGWTLQELLAPDTIIFYDRNWVRIGSVTQESDPKSWFLQTLGMIISFHPQYLLDKSGISLLPIAERMRWAARRETTREEDIAYCLLGIFKVNMPIMYGEGKTKAFKRLQYEIISTSYDHSIFAWRAPIISSSLFASSPVAFANSVAMYRLFPVSKNEQITPYTMTNLGLSIKLRLKEARTGTFLAELNCNQLRGDSVFRIFIYIQPLRESNINWPNMYRRVRCDEIHFMEARNIDAFDLDEVTDVFIGEDELLESIPSASYLKGPAKSRPDLAKTPPLPKFLKRSKY